MTIFLGKLREINLVLNKAGSKLMILLQNFRKGVYYKLKLNFKAYFPKMFPVTSRSLGT